MGGDAAAVSRRPRQRVQGYSWSDEDVPFPQLTDGFPIEVDRTEAGNYADLVMLQADLEFVLRLLDSIVPEMPERESDTERPTPDEDRVRAYWNAAVVAYARCFKEGSREKLRAEAILGDDRPALGSHKALLALRDRYIAHSVFDAERVQVFAGLAESPDAERQITGIGDLLLTRGLERRSRGEDLVDLSKRALASVESEMEVRRQDISRTLATRSYEELASRPRLANIPQLPDQLKPRSTHRPRRARGRAK